MRLALIVPVPCTVGDDEAALVERHRFNIAQACALSRQGAEVELLIDAPFTARKPLGDRAALAFVRRPTTALPIGAHLIGRAVRDHAEIIHVFHLLAVKSLVLASLAPVLWTPRTAAGLKGDEPGRSSRPARIYAEYNGGAIPASALRRFALKSASRRWSGVFFTSAASGRAFQEAGALARSLPIFEAPEISSLLRPGAIVRAAHDPLTVLVVARLAPDKQPFLALETFRELLRVRPDARLQWVYADDELGGAVQRAASGLPVQWIEKMPHREMSRLYAGADVMLHTSRREVCSAAFVEAMQHGLPIAASDIPAFRAMAGRGTKLVAGDDPRAWANAALELTKDPLARAEAQKTFERELSYDAIAKKKLAAYRCS